MGIRKTGNLWHPYPLSFCNHLLPPSGLGPGAKNSRHPQLPSKASAYPPLPHVWLSQIIYLSSLNLVKTHFHDLVPSYLFRLSPITPLYLINRITLWFPNMATLYLFCIFALALFVCSVSHQKLIPFNPWPSHDAISSMKASQSLSTKSDFFLCSFTVQSLCSASKTLVTIYLEL